MRLPTILVAAATLAVPASAADLGVLTSLDVCDSLGLSGLTVSSTSSCLQVSGEIYYEFHWGDYEGALPVLSNGYSGTIDWVDADADARDWESLIDAYLKVVATSPSDIGPAKAVIEIYGYSYGETPNGVDGLSESVELEQAYVSIGDQTILTAGRVDASLFNEDDDEAFGWLPSFMSDDPGGVGYDRGAGTYGIEGHVIQLSHKFGNGLSVGAALEDLDGAGSLIGVVNYASDTLSAHLSLLAGGALDGTVESYAMHAGVTATFDGAKVRGAFASNDSGWWNALASIEKTVDIFTLSATADGTSENEIGFTAAAEAKLNQQFTVKIAARYLDPNTGVIDDEGAEIRGRVEYAATEKLTLAAEAGHLFTGAAAPSGTQGITDGLLELTFKPGADFEATTAVAANTLGAYKVSFTASRTFQ